MEQPLVAQWSAQGGKTRRGKKRTTWMVVVKQDLKDHDLDLTEWLLDSPHVGVDPRDAPRHHNNSLGRRRRQQAERRRQNIQTKACKLGSCVEVKRKRLWVAATLPSRKNLL